MGNFEYNIGDKLYEFAIMSYEDFDKLKAIYTQLIELVCTAKEADTLNERMDCFFKMFQIVRACLEFSPYTHFYTQVLIDIIVKTYNSKVFRTDLLLKSQIGVLIENPKYYAKEFYEELEENEYTIDKSGEKISPKIDLYDDKYLSVFYNQHNYIINITTKEKIIGFESPLEFNIAATDEEKNEIFLK